MRRVYWGIAIAILASAVAAAFMVALAPRWLTWAPDWVAPPAKTSAPTRDYSALLVSTIVAFTGALSSILIASLGLVISRRQDERDNIEFAEERISNAVRRIADLVVAVDEVYSASIMLDSDIPELPRDLNAILGMAMPPDLRSSMDLFADRLDALGRSIAGVMSDEFSALAFRQGATRRGSELRKIQKTLAAFTSVEPSSYYGVTIENLPEVKSLIEVSAMRIRRSDLLYVAQARLVTNSSEVSMFDKAYDDRSVRSFMFLGNLLLHRAEVGSSEDPPFLVNFGAAMLHDLVTCAPDKSDLEAAYSARYGAAGESRLRARLDFDPANLVSSSFRVALQGADEIGGLYLMVGSTAAS